MTAKKHQAQLILGILYQFSLTLLFMRIYLYLFIFIHLYNLYSCPPFCPPGSEGQKQTETPHESQISAVFCFLLNILPVSPSLQGSSPAAPSADNKLVRTTRVRRQTSAGGQAPPLSSENQTAREQPLVFNHVYNINVPLESLCSVELDSAVLPGPTDGQFN